MNIGQPDDVSRFKITSLFLMTCVWVYGTKIETVGTSVEQHASDQLWHDYSVHLSTKILLLFFKCRSEVTIMSWFQSPQKRQMCESKVWFWDDRQVRIFLRDLQIIRADSNKRKEKEKSVRFTRQISDLSSDKVAITASAFGPPERGVHDAFFLEKDRFSVGLGRRVTET